METLGSGLASLAFWGGGAAIVVAAIWAATRRRQIQHETLRRIIESGQDVDPEVMNRLLACNNQDTQRPDVGLTIASIIVGFVAIGIFFVAFFVSIEEPDALFPILGGAFMIGCVALGLFVAGKVTKRTLQKEQQKSSSR